MSSMTLQYQFAIGCCLLLFCLCSATPSIPSTGTTGTWRSGRALLQKREAKTLSSLFAAPWLTARKMLSGQGYSIPAKSRFSSITFVASMCGKAAVTSPNAFSAKWTNQGASTVGTMENSMFDVSYGQVTFSSGSNIVVAISIPCSGPATSPFSTSTCTGPDLQGWMSYGESIASQAYDLTQFTHRIMLLPPGNPCGSSGLSTQSSMLAQGRSSIWVWLTDASSLPLPSILHETGHTLGLRHAAVYGSTWEQGDSSSLMGAVAPMRCFAAPNVWQLGWGAEMQDVTMDSLELGSWWSADVQPLGQAPSFVRLLPGATGGHTYFLSYRTAVGCDVQLDTQFLNKVSVHIYDGDDMAQGTSLSYLVALVTTGQQWTPSRVDRPSNVVIQLSSSSSGGAGASIRLCRYGALPSECGGAEMPRVSSALPNDQCNYNGSCETIFGETSCGDCRA